MTDGIIFDIREFALHDGPGIRTTVFLKGCPLVCVWCHNPEGKAPAPQVMHTLGGDRIVGKTYTPQALATYLNHQAAILAMNEGGVTFSGGEPLMQAQFIHETLDLLTPIHCLLDTSGYANPSLFRQIVTRFHLVYFDLKLIDEQAHLAYTGVSNAPILANLHTLAQCGVPYVIRVPLIPSITDTEANLNAIAETVKGLPGLERVDLLPYNTLAGAKYPQLGLTYMLPDITTQTIQHRAEIFSGKGIPVLCQ